MTPVIWDALIMTSLQYHSKETGPAVYIPIESRKHELSWMLQ